MVEVVAVVEVVESALPPPARAATPAAARAGAMKGTKFCTSPTGGRMMHSGLLALAARLQSIVEVDCAIALVADSARAVIVRRAYLDIGKLTILEGGLPCTARESKSSLS